MAGVEGAGPAGEPGVAVGVPRAEGLDPADRTFFAGKAAFWWVWPGLVVLDLVSKAWVFAFLDEVARQNGQRVLPEHLRVPWVVFDSELLRFDLVTWGNTGTIWGIFQDATVPLMVVRCGALIALVWFLRHTARAAKVQQVVLSLVFAGAVGNLYDNFTRADRSVRDFLHFSGTWPGKWDFPAFNVADSCITVGAICLFVLLWRNDRKPKSGPVS